MIKRAELENSETLPNPQKAKLYQIHINIKTTYVITPNHPIPPQNCQIEKQNPNIFDGYYNSILSGFKSSRVVVQ